MALFDAATLSDTDISLELITQANIGVDKLRARLVDEIAMSVIPPLLIRSGVQIFFQGHIRRSLMFIEGGYDAYSARRGLVAYSCARAIYETVACVLDFCDKLTDHLADGDFEKTATFIHSRQFAARMKDFIGTEDGFDNTAVNILTQIDRVSKHLPGLRDKYDQLSEKTHPNELGALHYFWESGEDVIKFSSGTDSNFVIQSLVSAGRLLFVMERGMTVLERKLKTLPF